MYRELAFSGYCLACGAPAYGQSYCNKCAEEPDEEEAEEKPVHIRTGRCRIVVDP